MVNPVKTNNTQNSRIQTKLNNQEIQNLINKIESILNGVVMEYKNISAEELVNYFDDTPPSGDLTTLSDIIDNQWLLVHELVELSELKNMKLPISSKLLRTHPTEVDYAHITATEYEFRFAKESDDLIWINSRIKDVKSWLKDESMPDDLKTRCSNLIREYSG